jgi:serine/threonine-protein kinase
VYLDDEPLGATSPATGRLVKRDLPQGRHQVRVAFEGYADLVHDVDLTPGATTTLHAPLGRKPVTTHPGFLAAAVAVGLLAALALWSHARRRRSASLFESTTARRDALYGPGVARPGVRTPRAEPATPTPPDALPARFGEYQLLERIGRGGMASVFKAERNGELRALKRPRASLSDDPQYLERFLRESEIGRTLHHPNIIRIYERGEAEGHPYFTMELIDGETLAERLRRDGAFAPAEAARLVLQIVEALDYAHSKGVIHRDLKPSNTMLARDGTLKVMDFGIARAQRFEGMTVTGSFLGSPDYAAPETIEGRDVDARSDLYAVGVVFFELLTGRRPFEGETSFTILQKHCSEAPVPPSRLLPGIPPELDAITLRLLAKAPEGRYASAEQLLLALRGWLDAQR